MANTDSYSLSATFAESGARLVSITPGKVLALLCGVYALAACLIIPGTYWSVFNAYPIVRYFFLAPILVFLGLLAAAVIHSPRAPLTFIGRKLASRGVGAVMILAVLILSATAFTAFKHEFSNWVTFFADQPLADLDRAIHGTDPWRLAHRVMPPALEPVLYSLYLHLWFVQLLGMIVMASFLEDEEKRIGYLFAFAVTVIFLGTAVRLGGSSAGPIFYDRMAGGARFGDLILALQQTPGGQGVLKVADYLYASYAHDRTTLGTGISAMPSLHVAIAVLNAFFVSSLSRFWGRLAWAYAAAILFGSVYFGWHYALDGYVSILFVSLFWRGRKAIFGLTDLLPRRRPGLPDAG